MRTRNVQTGTTLVEAVIALTILGMMMLIAVSVVSERIRVAKIRSACDSLAVHLRAARLQAVAKRTPVDVTVSADPANFYQYTDAQGRTRRVDMPANVEIASTTSPITFEANGAVSGGASTVLQIGVSDGQVERWTVTTSILGIPTTDHERVYE